MPALQWLPVLLCAACASVSPTPPIPAGLVEAPRALTPAGRSLASPATTPAGDAPFEEQLPAPESAGLWSDLGAAPSAVGTDLRNVFLSPQSWILLGGSYLADQGLLSTGANDSSTRYFGKHSIFSSGASTALETWAPIAIMAGAGTWYAWADQVENESALANSKKLLRSLSSTLISTEALKILANTDRPDGSKHGYPSGHTALSVAAATSLWYSEGPRFGAPLAVLAGLISLQRLDSLRHDPGDIIGGATLGWMIATTVSRGEPFKLWGAAVAPTIGTQGELMLSLKWSK